MQTFNGPLTGGCLCGAIRYELASPALFVSQCCCRDCQKATGTGHVTAIGVHRSQLRFTCGEPKPFASKGESGGDIVRHFCAHCGGRIHVTGTRAGELVLVQAGSLDDPDAVTPESVIYTKDAARWDHFDPALPSFPAMPPAAPPT
ncbi:MAG: hypothetical protein RLZZ200_1505 [Pseudomonadota bacterium]|jgi:hypothetical protein